jgi:hypothetical protein
MVYLAVLFFFSYLDINMIVPNVLVFIHVCHAETTGTGDTKKEYISIETSLRFKEKFIYIFSYFKFNSSMELTTKTLNIFFSSRCHYCRNLALCLMAEKVFIS